MSVGVMCGVCCVWVVVCVMCGVLFQLCEEFAMVAARVGKTIISELFLPLEQKTIPPITSRVGGVAGGEKFFFEVSYYLSANMLFMSHENSGNFLQAASG